MHNSNNISLIDALDISIKRIINNYNGKWVITRADGTDALRLSHNEEQIGLKYEKIAEAENHNFTEICICLNGSCALQIGDYIDEINEGDVCLILPGVLHNELPKKDCGYTAVWMAINLNRTALHLSGKNAEKGAFYTIDGFTSKSNYDFNLTLSSINIEITSNSFYCHEMIKSYVLQLLVTTLRKIQDTAGNKQSNESWKQSVILQVQNYIKTNYSRNIRLSEISQEICISANYLNTIYKSVTGKTITQYTEAFKIDKAKDLLANTGQSAACIAERLGYYDQYHFSKVFKRETGYTPTYFRKLQLDLV